jgi:hypothetical protein
MTSLIVERFSGIVSNIFEMSFFASGLTLDHSASGNAYSPALILRFIPGEIG